MKDTELLGKTAEGWTASWSSPGWQQNLLDVPDDQMNKPFKDWKQALTAFRTRGAIKFKRLERGDTKAFDFLAREDIKVEVLGPDAHRHRGEDAA